MPWPMLLLVAVLQTAAVPSSIETVSRGDMSGVEETREAVARTAGEWAALWREHAGATPTPKITGTRTDGAGLVVLWAERRPERGMVAAQIMTSPGHIVTVPRVTGPIRFEKAGQ